MPQDVPEATIWLSYAELSASRGISKASAIRLARRRKWLKRRGNDGGVRVAVPEGEEKPKRDDPEDDLRDDPGDNLQDDRADISSIVKEFAATVASLTERAVAAEARAERAKADRDALKTELVGAEAARAAVEADAERSWRQGRWARVRKAWRGR